MALAAFPVRRGALARCWLLPERRAATQGMREIPLIPFRFRGSRRGASFCMLCPAIYAVNAG